MSALVFALIGVVAGLLGGMFGIGGGIVIVPALIYLMGYGQKMAQGTSLVVFLLPVGILGVMNYYKDKNADLAAGAIIAAGLFVGAYFGSRIAIGMDEGVLRKSFSVLLVVVAAQLFFRK